MLLICFSFVSLLKEYQGIFLSAVFNTVKHYSVFSQSSCYIEYRQSAGWPNQWSPSSKSKLPQERFRFEKFAQDYPASDVSLGWLSIKEKQMIYTESA